MLRAAVLPLGWILCGAVVLLVRHLRCVMCLLYAYLPACLQNGAVLKEGDFVSINGTTGEVIKGQQPVKKPGVSGDLATFMKWVDAKRRLKVLTNADTPEDSKVGFWCWLVLSELWCDPEECSFAGLHGALQGCIELGPGTLSVGCRSQLQTWLFGSPHGSLCQVLPWILDRSCCPLL